MMKAAMGSQNWWGLPLFHPAVFTALGICVSLQSYKCSCLFQNQSSWFGSSLLHLGPFWLPEVIWPMQYRHQCPRNHCHCTSCILWLLMLFSALKPFSKPCQFISGSDFGAETVKIWVAQLLYGRQPVTQLPHVCSCIGGWMDGSKESRDGIKSTWWGNKCSLLKLKE